MTLDGEEGQGQLIPLALLVVCSGSDLAAICERALDGLDGVQSHQFSDRSAALAWAYQHELAGVVIDNELPGMNAQEFLRNLPVAADRPRPHVILVCEGTPHDVPAAARNAGVDDIVTKPVEPETFAALVRSALTLRLAERADRSPAEMFSPRPPPPATGPPEPPEAPAPPDAPAPPEAPSRRRAAMRWFVLALLLLLLFVGCYRYREATSGGRMSAATPPPTSRSGARESAKSGAAGVLLAPWPVGTGNLGMRPAPRATRPAGSSTAGVAPDASSPLGGAGAPERSAPFAADGGAALASGGDGEPSGGDGDSVRTVADAAAAPGSGAGSAQQQSPGLPAGAPAAGASAAASPPAGEPGGSAAGAAPGDAGADAAAAAAPPAAPGAGAAHAAAKAAGAGGASPAAGAAKPLTAPANGGFLVLDAAGRSVAESQPDVARAPASTIKVLTAAVAIATLGANARFRTELVAQGGVRDGAVDGSLALVGGGDPVLTSADIDAAAAELERRGVREIRGDVVIDATAFAGPEHNPHWTAADRSAPYGPGTSAISIDEGTRVQSVNGALVSQTIADQQAFAGSVLGDRLRAHHITIDGTVRAGRSTGGTVLWAHESPPLAVLIRTMLIESDNHIAESVLREIGLAAGGAGSETDGIAKMRAYLAQHGVPADGLRLFDGSGLAPDDRATPRTLATLMWRIAGTPEGNIIHASLTAAGNRAGQSEAAGFIRLKTGRAGTARGIVGTVDRGLPGALSFAFLDTVKPAASSAARQALEETELHRLADAVP